MESFWAYHHEGSQAERFFVARYLDNPLIADKLDQDILDCTRSWTHTREGYHLRNVIAALDPSIRGSQLCSEHDPTHAVHGLMTRCESRHVRLITPGEIIHLAEETPVMTAPDSFPEEVLDLQTECVNAYFRSVGVNADLTSTLSTETLQWFRREDTLEVPQRRLVTARARGDRETIMSPLTTKFGSRIAMSDKYVILGSPEHGELVVMTYDMFLAWLDIVRVRGRASLACDLVYQGTLLRERLTRQTAWQRRWIDEFGNEGFELAKMTEGLAKTYLSFMTDPELRSGGPYEAMWKKLEGKLNKICAEPLRRATLLLEQQELYERIVAGASVSEVAELFGLQKTIGHPFIYVERGGRSAAKEALEHVHIPVPAAAELRAAWCSMFTSGYLKKERKWPPLVFADSAKTTQLYRWYRSNYTNLDAQDFDLTEWNGVLFGECLEYNPHPNILELVDDKAISLYRGNLEAYWDSDVSPESFKRLILEIMAREKLTFMDIVNTVERDEVPDSWLVVCLYPKEREFKIDARMFAILVLEMRTFFAGNEANLAESVFPYLDAQTMTKSGVAIDRQFYQITEPREDPQNLHLFVELDLSRWNLKWRDVVISRIAADFDCLFGRQRTFSFVHKFFARSVVVVRTPRLRPDGIELFSPPEGPLVWYNHLGGFEGLAQKTWSTATYAMVDRSMRNVACSRILIGQGDNQVMSMVFPRDPLIPAAQQCKAMYDDVTQRLARGCAEVNQDMKTEECVGSRTVLSYSKKIYVRGLVYPLSIKMASRAFARTSEEIPSLSAELAALHSATLAGAESSRKPLALYLMASYLTAREIRRRSLEDHPEWDRVPASRMEQLRRISKTEVVQML